MGMGIFRKYFRAMSVMLVVVIAVMAYDAISPSLYEVTSRVVVHRSPVETPNYSTEESKNRWIWVRDGYAIKDSLLSQPFLSALLTQSPGLQDRYKEYLADNAATIKASSTHGVSDSDLQIQFLAEFKEGLEVDYLGGDAFTYVIKVRDKSAVLAKEVAVALVEKLRALVVDNTRQSYARSLAALQVELRKNQTPEVQQYLGETYRSILGASILFDASADRRIEVVQAPSIPLKAVWPKLDRLLILAAVAGLALGLLLEYLISWAKRHELQTA